MKRSYAALVLFVLCTLIIPFTAHAVTVDQPHSGVVTSYSCSTCHTNHLTLGSDAAGFNNVCQTCHRVGDSAAGAKPITSADAANPFNNHTSYGIQKFYQTSHRWDGPLDVPVAGAQAPIHPLMSSVTNRSSSQLNCSICHNQHDNTNGKFLRISNTNDALCMDCHRSRAVNSHEGGSHPVNVTVPANSAYVLKNANPANVTSDMSAQLAKSGGKVLCTTCHGVHVTDSRSSTFDGFSSSAGRGRNFNNLSTGDGYLLRTDRRGKAVVSGATDNINICTSCHAGKKNHNYNNQNVQCDDCHGAHVEFDPNDPTNTKGNNKYLVRRNVTKFGQPNQIMFRYTGSKREYVNAQNTGVCQGCHDVPAPGGLYPSEHASLDANVCNNCHAHGNTRGSFAGACNTCHGHPPTTSTVGGADGIAAPATNAVGSAGAHGTHVNLRKMDCSTCHDGYSNRTMPNSTIDLGFAVDSTKFPGFKSVANTGTYGNTNTLNVPYTFTGSVDRTGVVAPNQTCANIYCHGATLKNDAGLPTGSSTKPNWTLGSAQAQCDSCHAIFGEGPGTAGHVRHAGAGGANLNLGCDNCHGLLPSVTSSGGWFGPNHVNGVSNWDVSPLAAPQAGSAAPAYKANGGIYAVKGATNVLAPSTAYGSCSNVYCHSNIQGSAGFGAPTLYATPTWGKSSLTCGSCHLNMATDLNATGNHVTHANSYNIGCGVCHTGYTVSTANPTLHTKNTAIDVIFPATGISAGSKYDGTNAGGRTPGFGYASCTTSYCHSNSGPNGSTRIYPAVAPMWGGAKLSCGSCHQDMSTSLLATGSHLAHSSSARTTGGQYGCEMCHTGYTDSTVTTATHVDQKVNLGFSVPGTYSKSAPIASGSTFGTCSATVCHGSATAMPWGGTLHSTTDQCAKCHAGPATGGLFYSTSFPTKQTSNTDAKAGAHTAHLTSTFIGGVTLTCTDCHANVTLKSPGHMNGSTEVVWSSLATNNGALTPSYTAGRCDNTYCHGAGLAGGTTAGRSPSWNAPFLSTTLTPEACGTCHGFPPATTSHIGLQAPTGFPATSCGCHPTFNPVGSAYANIFKVGSKGEKHIDGKVDGDGNCNACHGYPPANKRFKGTHNNWSSARQESYSGSGGAHTVAGHVPPTAMPGQEWSNCNKCHNPADHVIAPLEFKPSKNIKVRIDSRVRFANVPSMGKYSSNRLDGAAHVPGNCSNVACHFQRTPKW